MVSLLSGRYSRLCSGGDPGRSRRSGVPPPPARQHREGRERWRLNTQGMPAPAAWPLHDCEAPAPCFVGPGTELLAAVGHVGPDVLEPSTALVRRGQAPGGHVGIAQIGGVDEDTPPETRRVHEEMALAAVTFLRPIITMRPPVAVVSTVWGSIIAADGWG
jgi:hypothetical protein